MFQVLRGPLTGLGRLLLCTIFFMAAVGNKIPHFNAVAKVMDVQWRCPGTAIAAPVGAIVFLLVGSLSVIVGYKARIGGCPAADVSWSWPATTSTHSGTCRGKPSKSK